MDLGIEVILELFKKDTFEEIFKLAFEDDRIQSQNCQRIYALKDTYLKSLDDVI